MPAPESGSIQLLSAMKNVVTWTLVILGWMVVSDQQEDREIRKEAISRLAAFRKEVADLEVLVVAHHTSAWDADRMAHLQRRFGRLGREASLLKALGCFEFRWIEIVRDFKTASLLQNCDVSSHKLLAPNDPRITEIHHAADSVDHWASNAVAHRATNPRSLLASLWSVILKRLF